MAFYLSLDKGPRTLLADFPSVKMSMMGMPSWFIVQIKEVVPH